MYELMLFCSKLPLEVSRRPRYCVPTIHGVRSWRNGRRAALRSLWGNTRESSSLSDRTTYLKIYFYLHVLNAYLNVLTDIFTDKPRLLTIWALVSMVKTVQGFLRVDRAGVPALQSSVSG